MSKEVIALLAVLIPALITLIVKVITLISARKMDALKLKEQELKNKALEQDLRNAEQSKFEDAVKYSFFQQLMDLTAMNNITNSISELFKLTKADRFLILAAINGKTKFNVVSVVYQQHDEIHPNYIPVDAMKMYQNVGIDDVYKSYLDLSEIQEFVEINVDTMQDGVLKNFYTDEKIKHSLIKSITRKPLDENNDFLVYSSIATHSEKEFTELEKSKIKNYYEAIIIPNVVQILENPIMN